MLISNGVKKGFTFIDVLVGTALVLIVFFGIFGVYQLGLKVVGQSKARITATALANQKIELARNLPYKNVGTVGGGPEGIFGPIPDEVTATTNNIEYKIITAIYFVDDCADGTLAEKEECPEKAGQDEFPNDYRKVKVRVFWTGRFGGEVVLTTDIAPKGLELAEGYGALDISVFGATGQGVEIDLPWDQPPPCPPTSIHIINESTGLNYCYKTDATGHRLLVLKKSEPAEDYKIIVNKAGFSQDRTYGTDEIANPSKPHATVLEGKLTEISFSIDKLSKKKVDTVKPPEYWEDLFNDTLKISTSSNVSISGGEVKLGLIDSEYISSGYLISTTITPENLKKWNQLSWTDNEPQNTTITIQLLYFNGTEWISIPDADLPGNSAGFGSSPVDLSSLNPNIYSSLRLRANFSTEDSSVTSVLFDWKIGWQSYIPNIAFHLQGTKIIGGDEDGNPVFKYSITTSTDAQGYKEITNLEWDLYTITVSGTSTGYDISASNPPQPVDIPPDTTITTTLTLVSHANHTLLVTVTDINNNPLEGATTTLSKTGYEKTLITGSSGQSFFTPLTEATYDLEIALSGYATTTLSVEVSGQTEERVIMTLL